MSNITVQFPWKFLTFTILSIQDTIKKSEEQLNSGLLNDDEYADISNDLIVYRATLHLLKENATDYQRSIELE